MRYPKAYKGIRKLYTGNILTFIALFCMMIVLAISFEVSRKTNAGIKVSSNGLAALLLLLLIAFVVLMVIALILYIVGVVQASKDEPQFKRATAFLFLALAAFIINRITNGISQDVFNYIYSLLSFCAMLFVMRGIIALAKKLCKPDVKKKGKKTIMIYVVVFCFSLLINLINQFIANDTVSTVLSVLALCFSIAYFAVELSLVASAKRMLIE